MKNIIWFWTREGSLPLVGRMTWHLVYIITEDIQHVNFHSVRLNFSIFGIDLLFYQSSNEKGKCSDFDIKACKEN